MKPNEWGPVLIIIVVIILICTIINAYITGNGRLTEHDKTMRALRLLIYFILFLIIAGIVIRLFFWTAFISFFKR